MGAMVLLHRPLMELTTLQMGLRTTPMRLPQRRTDRTLFIMDISTVNHKRTKPLLHTSTHRISIRHINIQHISIHLTDLTDPEVRSKYVFPTFLAVKIHDIEDFQ
jgi:hypothetical protein